MRVHLHLPATVLIIVVVGVPAAVWGQSLRTGSSQGMFGSRSLGSSLSPGTRTLGQSPMSTLGGSGVGGNVGQSNLSGRFVRANRQPGEFVGADTREVREFIGAVQALQGTGQASQTGVGPRGTARPGTPNQPGGGRRTAVEVRNVLSVGFKFPATTAVQTSTVLAARIEKSERIQTISPVQVEMREGTATLRGMVATAHDRELAGLLARLEPGIWQVKNELAVAELPAESAPSEPVAPPAGPGAPAGQQPDSADR